MGVCASSHSPKATTKKALPSPSPRPKSGARAFESFRRPSTIMVMDMEGGIREYKHPIPASHVASEISPGCFLCNSESMYIGTCMPRVPDEEDLLPGRIYFLVPQSHSNRPLTLPLLCDLAVKAGSALGGANNNSNTS